MCSIVKFSFPQDLTLKIENFSSEMLTFPQACRNFSSKTMEKLEKMVYFSTETMEKI